LTNPYSTSHLTHSFPTLPPPATAALLVPSTPLFRSLQRRRALAAPPISHRRSASRWACHQGNTAKASSQARANKHAPMAQVRLVAGYPVVGRRGLRSEEHTSELQSRFDLVCRLLLEKKKQKRTSSD